MNIEAVIVVFVAAVLELWLAVPLGLLLGLPPVLTAFMSALGSAMAACVVILIGGNLKDKILKLRYKDEEKIKNSQLYNMWNKYGVLGLGMLSPLLLGAPLGAAVGMALGAEKNRLLLWMNIGIGLWSVGLTLALFIGFMTIEPNNMPFKV